MRQVPGGPWGKTWLAAGVLFVVCAIGLELFVRGRGFVPSIKDDAYSWSLERRKVSDGSHRTVAILGASRILLAFAPSAFREVLPDHRFVMLAQQGSAPIGSLRDLALDPGFRGVVLVDIGEYGFAEENWGLQDHLIATYHRGWRSIGQLAERWLTTEVQARIALFAAGGLRTLRSLFVQGRWPRPVYTTTYPDRTKFANYDLVDVDRKRMVRLARMEGAQSQADLTTWLTDALAQELYITLIHLRGGKVVYIRMPTCDERWETDEVLYPKAVFWDRLAQLTQAVTVHFKDHPQLSGFACPDTSHIASKDGPRFTRALLEILAARGVFAGP